MVGIPSFMCLAFSLFPPCGVGCSLGIECHIPPYTLPLFFVFCMHWQGSQGVDRFVVHWGVIALQNPCQLFCQLTNDLWHVVFCWFL